MSARHEFASYAELGARIALADTLGFPQLPDANTPIGAIGLTDAEVQRVSARLADLFHVTLDVPSLLGHTAASYGAAVAQAPINSRDPVMHVAGPDSGPPLVVIHGADGEVGWFLKHLRDGAFRRGVYGLTAPGWRDDPVPDSIGALAEEYLGWVRERWPHGPYQLAGYCSGTVLAMAMASRLAELGERVDRLFVVDPDFDHVPVVTREAVMFRLHQLRRKPEPSAWLFARLARELSLDDALRRLTGPPAGDPVERQFYRALRVLTALVGLRKDVEPKPVAAACTMWLTDAYTTSLGVHAESLLTRAHELLGSGVDVRRSTAAHTDLFADDAFLTWLVSETDR